jgi:hypothetical protein
LRKSILIILAVGLMAGSASAKLGDLVQSFSNIGSGTHYCLAADANYLYSGYYYSTWRYPVIRMRRSNGAYVSSYPMPGPTYPQYNRGACYDGTGFIYYNNYSRRYVTRARASNGSLISTWTYPTTTTRYGLCVDHKGTSAGTNIFTNYVYNSWWVNSLTGSQKRAFRAPVNNYAYDLAWDWNNNMIWYGNYSDEYIYGINPANGSVRAKFPLPVGPDNPYGIAYWGYRLYVSTTSGSPDEYIWVFDCPGTVGVTPASVGRIKALFE